MIFVFGGRCQGKLAFVKERFGENLSVCSLRDNAIKDTFSFDVITDIEAGIRELLKSGDRPAEFFAANQDRFADKIIIGNEIGCGIVPIDGFERLWRDETGWFYQMLCKNADEVYRVWAGIGKKYE